jgi:dTDP-4-dehydrorhamnose reductase
VSLDVLVTGAAGMLGRDVVAAAAARGWRCVGLARDDLDITDRAAVTEALRAHSPAAVLNCAAWTNVDGAEEHEADAFAANVSGPFNLATASREAGARLVHVSTDYVFDGTATAPYVESDPIGPIGAYGRTKLAGEWAVLAASDRHVVARTAWIFGLGRRNFVADVLERAAAREEIKAFTDQRGCPTYSVHLADKLLDLATGDRGGVFHEAASGQCSRFEFAQAILARAGVDAGVTPSLRAELPAPRPAWSVLASERDEQPLPSWEDGLDAYLAERAAVA